MRGVRNTAEAEDIDESYPLSPMQEEVLEHQKSEPLAHRRLCQLEHSQLEHPQSDHPLWEDNRDRKRDQTWDPTSAASFPNTSHDDSSIHAFARGSHSGTDIVQVIGRLHEETDGSALWRAWEQVVQRHAVLRSGFRVGKDRSRQEIHRHVRLRFGWKDWRGLTDREQADRLEAYLQADRCRGFELHVPPLTRLALFRVGAADHILAWTFHQVLLDSGSAAFLLEEVFKCYDTVPKGTHRQEPDPPAGRTGIEGLQKPDWPAIESSWKARLRGLRPGAPAIGLREEDRVRRAPVRPGMVEVTLDAAQTDRLRGAVRDHGFSLNVLFQAAWAVLLHRYSGEEDIVFGTVHSCRRGATGAQSIRSSPVGLFTRTLPVRLRINPELRLADGLRRLMAQRRAHADDDQAASAEIHRWSGLTPGQPLCRTLFQFDDPPWDGPLRARGGAWANREFTMRRQPPFSLWLEVAGGPPLQVRLGCDGRQSRNTMATDLGPMLGHYLTLVEGMAKDLSQPVAELPLLSGQEQRKLLVEWNATRVPCAPRASVVELFEAQVERTPNAVALVHGKEEVSYRELDNQANRVSRHLRSLAVGPDVPVAIGIVPSVGMVAGMMGILKAGGACLPLDPSQPRDRIQFMLEDSGARVLLAEPESARVRFPLPPGKGISLERLRRGPDAASAPVRVTPDNHCFLAYASACAGGVRGVQIPHRALLNLVSWHQRNLAVRGEDRVALLAGSVLDTWLWGLLPCLAAGAGIWLPEEDSRQVPVSALPEWIQSRKMTVALMPAAMSEEALTLAWPEDTTLRTLITGGDHFRCRPSSGLPFQVFHLHGSEETAWATAFTRLDPGSDCRPGSVGMAELRHVGRPMGNAQVYVLDRLLRPLPVGVPGELFVGGPGLACGYRNDPALTAERFVPHPFDISPGARLYRTGDLVRWRADGSLEFIRRTDRRMSLCGQRVEPAEIEERLNQHPAVRECLVVDRGDGRGHRNGLVAYYVPRSRSGGTTVGKELADFLGAVLPEFMVPGAFVALESWPLTTEGGLDFGALPRPDRPFRAARRAFLAPRSPLEDAVARVWSEVLGCAPLGVHDNFFELGGHSLQALQAVSRLKQTLNVPLSIRSLFERPTVNELAREIMKTITRSAPPGTAGIARVRREAYRLPSSPADAQLAPAR